MLRRPSIHLLMLGPVLLLMSTAAKAQDVIIVVNRDVAISEITDVELHDIFTGARSTFRDRSRAVPVLLKGGPAHEVFLSNHLGETSDSFRSSWRKAVFTGQGVTPKEFTSEDAMLHYIAVTQGAIGYVSRVNGAENVKVLTVKK